MLSLKLLLYFICIVSLSWASLIFAGPFVLGSLISSYSQNQLIASGITITPKLDIRVSRLEFALKDKEGQVYQKGFSRSGNIFWTLFGEEPFVKVKLGPTFIENIFVADDLTIYTPHFSDIDFNSILLKAEARNLELGSSFQSELTDLQAVYRVSENSLNSITVNVPSIVSKALGSWGVAGLSANIDQLDLNNLFEEQDIAIAISANQIESISESLGLVKPNGFLIISDEEIAFQFTTQELKHFLSGYEVGGFRVKGAYAKSGYLKSAYIRNSTQNSKNDASNIIIEVVNETPTSYKIKVSGDLVPMPLTVGENFVGNLPASDFDFDFIFDGDSSVISSRLHILVKNEELLDIVGSSALNLELENSAKISDCFILGCALLGISFDYIFNVDKEWIAGKSSCYSNTCELALISHQLRTSNTVKLFEIINQSKILNPLYSAYLYAVISSGKKMDNGHEIIIN